MRCLYHTKVEQSTVTAARMLNLSESVSVIIFFSPLLKATGVIVTVDIILLKLYVNVKSEDREDTLSNKDEVKRHVNIMI